MALTAVIDKHCFERGLNAGDNRLVDVAFFLFLTGVLDIQIDEFLSVNNGNAKLFGLGCVE